MEKKLHVVSLVLKDRTEVSPEMQRIIADFCESLRGRFSLPDNVAGKGLVILVMECEDETIRQMCKRLDELGENVALKVILIA